MKKYLFSILLILNLTLITICACQMQEVEQPQDFYKLEYLATEGGSISGNAEQSVESGKNGTEVTAIPDNGYIFDRWSDDDSVNPSRIDTNVNSDVIATAIFKKLTYSLKYETDGNGTIDGKTNQTVEYGKSSIAVTAIADEGFKFVKWSDGITTPERQDKSVVGDLTVTALFERLTFSLSYDVGNGGYLTGNTNQTVAHGESGTKVTAIPNDGYKFVKWSDGQTSDTRCDDEIVSDLIVTAEFEFLFAGGEGTRFNPFTIENYTQLMNIRSFPDKNYRLICDLDLSGINHEPIFDANECFSGEFDGGNKTIKNLTVHTDSNFPSLFGMVADGIIADLNLENASITTVDFNTMEDGVKYYVGTIAGYVAGFLDNVNVSGNITVNALSYDGAAIGGLVGMVIGTISDCSADVQINVKNVFSTYTNNMNYPFVFGGMLGVADSAYIRDCSVAGQINVTECFSPEGMYADILIGGMVGYYFAYGQVNSYIRNCETDISIYGDTFYKTGGFIGQIMNGGKLSVTNNSVYGDITVGDAGGFIYRIDSYGDLLIENCNIVNSIIAFSEAAGFILQCVNDNGNLDILNCQTKGDIKIHKYGDENEVVGEGSGFCSLAWGVRLMNCVVLRNINAAHAIGFCLNTYHDKVNACCFVGEISVGGSGNRNFHGIGFAMSIDNSEIYNCFVNAYIKYDKADRLWGLAESISNSAMADFYAVGICEGELFGDIENSNILNGHVLRDFFGGDLSEEVEVMIYENAEDMYYLADKLNGGDNIEVWVNVDNDFPKLKFYTN